MTLVTTLVAAVARIITVTKKNHGIRNNESNKPVKIMTAAIVKYTALVKPLVVALVRLRCRQSQPKSDLRKAPFYIRRPQFRLEFKGYSAFPEAQLPIHSVTVPGSLYIYICIPILPVSQEPTRIRVTGQLRHFGDFIWGGARPCKQKDP